MSRNESQHAKPAPVEAISVRPRDNFTVHNNTAQFVFKSDGDGGALANQCSFGELARLGTLMRSWNGSGSWGLGGPMRGMGAAGDSSEGRWGVFAAARHFSACCFLLVLSRE